MEFKDGVKNTCIQNLNSISPEIKLQFNFWMMRIESIEEVIERCFCVRSQAKDVVKVAEVNQR